MIDDLFPGFTVSPNDPSRELRPAFTIAGHPEEDQRDDGEFDDSEPGECEACEGWGYFICHCGGDICICSYNGERPCWECA